MNRFLQGLLNGLGATGVFLATKSTNPKVTFWSTLGSIFLGGLMESFGAPPHPAVASLVMPAPVTSPTSTAPVS